VIPVQFDSVANVNGDGEKPAAGVCAEYTHCGKVVRCAYDPEDRAPVRRVKEAKAAALALLPEQCGERTPWGCVPAHCDRGVPRGVAIYAEDHLGVHWPLTVDDRGKLNTAAGGCAASAVVLVVPESDDSSGGAREFAEHLRANRGYAKARAVRPGHKLNPPRKAKEAS
jgi:hypothetical protein